MHTQITTLQCHTTRNVRLPSFRCFHVLSPLNIAIRTRKVKGPLFRKVLFSDVSRAVLLSPFESVSESQVALRDSGHKDCQFTSRLYHQLSSEGDADTQRITKHVPKHSKESCVATSPIFGDQGNCKHPWQGEAEDCHSDDHDDVDGNRNDYGDDN